MNIIRNRIVKAVFEQSPKEMLKLLASDRLWSKRTIEFETYNHLFDVYQERVIIGEEEKQFDSAKETVNEYIEASGGEKTLDNMSEREIGEILHEKGFMECPLELTQEIKDIAYKNIYMALKTEIERYMDKHVFKIKLEDMEVSPYISSDDFTKYMIEMKTYIHELVLDYLSFMDSLTTEVVEKINKKYVSEGENCFNLAQLIKREK